MLQEKEQKTDAQLSQKIFDEGFQRRLRVKNVV
jgi:hypothetical protein